jgi:hypothetical protein
MAMRVVLHWAKWIGSQPYDKNGTLDVAWMRILDRTHLSRLKPATENEPTEDKLTQAPATDNRVLKKQTRNVPGKQTRKTSEMQA